MVVVVNIYTANRHNVSVCDVMMAVPGTNDITRFLLLLSLKKKWLSEITVESDGTGKFNPPDL